MSKNLGCTTEVRLSKHNNNNDVYELELKLKSSRTASLHSHFYKMSLQLLSPRARRNPTSANVIIGEITCPTTYVYWSWLNFSKLMGALMAEISP